jgi:hypothetical protein
MQAVSPSLGALLIDVFGADGALAALLAVSLINVLLVMALFVLLKPRELRRPG